MEIIKIYFDKKLALNISINLWIVAIGLLIIIIWFLRECFYQKKLKGTHEIDGIEIGLGNQKIKIRPNYNDIQIAYKIWVELSTRKIGLPIDYDNDVIDEIYYSWYEFFKITRELIKEIPVNKVRSSRSTQNLVTLATEILNKGIRPHLTQWQARFKKWYKAECLKEANNALTPQDIQKKYEFYDELKQDMNHVNVYLMKYKEFIREIVFK